jgi:equilibrative nucleoside transporter 1/2/3
LDLATSGKGGIGTFIGICVCSGLFGIADAHVQGGMVGDLSYMLPEFIQVSITDGITMRLENYVRYMHFVTVLLLQSFLAGTAASGALTSALRLITKAVFENSPNGLRKGASKFNSRMLRFQTFDDYVVIEDFSLY